MLDDYNVWGAYEAPEDSDSDSPSSDYNPSMKKKKIKVKKERVYKPKKQKPAKPAKPQFLSRPIELGDDPALWPLKLPDEDNNAFLFEIDQLLAPETWIIGEISLQEYRDSIGRDQIVKDYMRKWYFPVKEI